MAEMEAAPANDAVVVLRALTQSGRAHTNRREVYAAMIEFAAACLKRNMTQTAADTLAFLLQEPGVSAAVRDEAAEILDDLERRACPRVTLDARTFAEGMDLLTMLEYLLDVVAPETT